MRPLLFLPSAPLLYPSSCPTVSENSPLHLNRHCHCRPPRALPLRPRVLPIATASSTPGARNTDDKDRNKSNEVSTSANIADLGIPNNSSNADADIAHIEASESEEILPQQVDPPPRPPPQWVFPDGDPSELPKSDDGSNPWQLWETASAAADAKAAEDPPPLRDPNAETDFWRSAARDVTPSSSPSLNSTSSASSSSSSSINNITGKANRVTKPGSNPLIDPLYPPSPSSPPLQTPVSEDRDTSTTGGRGTVGEGDDVTAVWGKARDITGEMSDLQNRLRDELDSYNPDDNVDSYRDIARELVGPPSDFEDREIKNQPPLKADADDMRSTKYNPPKFNQQKYGDEPERDPRLNDVPPPSSLEAEAGSGWNPDVDWMRFEDMDRVRKLAAEREAREANAVRAAAKRDESLSPDSKFSKRSDDDDEANIVEKTDWETPAWMNEPVKTENKKNSGNRDKSDDVNIDEKVDWETPAWTKESEPANAVSSVPVEVFDASGSEREKSKDSVLPAEVVVSEEVASGSTISEGESTEATAGTGTLTTGSIESGEQDNPVESKEEKKNDEKREEEEEEPAWMKPMTPEEEAAFEWTPPAWVAEREKAKAEAAASPPPEQQQRQVPGFIRNRMRSTSYGPEWSGAKEEIAALEAQGEKLRDPREDTDSWRSAARELMVTPSSTEAAIETTSEFPLEPQQEASTEEYITKKSEEQEALTEKTETEFKPTEEVEPVESDVDQSAAWSSWISGAMAWAADNKTIVERDPEAEVDMWRASARELGSTATPPRKTSPTTMAAEDTLSDESVIPPQEDESAFSSVLDKVISEQVTTSSADDDDDVQVLGESDTLGSKTDQSAAWSSWRSGAGAWVANNEKIVERDAKAEVDMWRTSAQELAGKMSTKSFTDTDAVVTPVQAEDEASREVSFSPRMENDATTTGKKDADLGDEPSEEEQSAAWSSWRSSAGAWAAEVEKVVPRDPKAEVDMWRTSARELGSSASSTANTSNESSNTAREVTFTPPTKEVNSDVQAVDGETEMTVVEQSDAWSSWRSGAGVWAADNEELSERDPKAEVDMWRSSARELTSPSSRLPKEERSVIFDASAATDEKEKSDDAWDAWRNADAAWQQTVEEADNNSSSMIKEKMQEQQAGAGTEASSTGDWGAGLGESKLSEQAAWAAWQQVSEQANIGDDAKLWFSTRAESGRGRDPDPFAVPVRQRGQPLTGGNAPRAAASKEERLASDGAVGSWLDFARQLEVGPPGEGSAVDQSEGQEQGARDSDVDASIVDETN